MSTVVLVGLRAGALDAAERLGLEVAAVVERAPGRKTASRCATVLEVAFDDPDGLSEVASVLEGAAPSAVVALTERSVVPAAHIRAALGLEGLTPEAARLCSDKRAMKRAVRSVDLRCADFIEADEGLDGDAIVERLGLPLVLKSAVGSGSRGTQIIRSRDEMPDVLEVGWMAESFVEGVEMSVESFVFEDETVWINPTQYLDVGWASLVPAPLPDELRSALEAHSDAARRALGVTSGITHLEVFLTPDGLVFGELAARPPGGHIMRLIRHAYGVDPWEALLRVALGQDPGLHAEASRAAAVRILHPGPGTVLEVGGLESARAIPGVEDVSVRIQPGDSVAVREGTGQEAGHVLVTAPSALEAEARLAAAVDVVRIEVG